MGVKPLKEIPWSKMMNSNAKSNRLRADILEIILKEMKYFEITDFPYSDKTGMSSIDFIVKQILRHELHDITGKWRDFNSPITITRIKEPDGKCRYCGTFNVESWKRIIEKISSEE